MGVSQARERSFSNFMTQFEIKNITHFLKKLINTEILQEFRSLKQHESNLLEISSEHHSKDFILTLSLYTFFIYVSHTS